MKNKPSKEALEAARERYAARHGKTCRRHTWTFVRYGELANGNSTHTQQCSACGKTRVTVTTASGREYTRRR